MNLVWWCIWCLLSEKGCQEAVKFTKVLFGGGINDVAALTQDEISRMFENSISVTMEYTPGMTLFEMCSKAGCFDSRSSKIIDIQDTCMSQCQMFPS